MGRLTGRTSGRLLRRGLRLAWWLALLCCCASVAWAGGETGEAEAIGSFNRGRLPQALSPDGAWLFHLDGDGLLHRRSASAPFNVAQTLRLPRNTLTLAPARGGQWLALATEHGCVGLVHLGQGAATADVLRWLDPELLRGADQPALVCPAQPDVNPHATPGQLYDSPPLALSPDGSLLAWAADGTVRLIDVATRQVRLRLPVADSRVLQLRFVDEGRRLLVVSALLGERWEDVSSPSAMQFAVWHLASGELHMLVQTPSSGSLLAYDLLWDFSERSGRLWTINTDGRYDERAQPQVRARIQPRALALNRCAMPIGKPLSLPPGQGDGWIELAADPAGRWLAAVEPTQGAGGAEARSTLHVWRTDTGALLLSAPQPAELRSLVPSADGRHLFGVLAGQPQPDERRYTRYMWSFEGRGTWVSVDLSALLAGLPVAPPATAWPAQRCALPDEQAGARELRKLPQRHQPMAELTLTNLLDVRARLDAARAPGDGPRPCDFESSDHPQFNVVAPWGLAADGALWLDRGQTLERIDPASGQVLARLPTPRSPQVCSRVSFSEGMFLNWQGDTVTLRPFDGSSSSAAARRLLAQRPGWRAEAAAWVAPGHVGVVWVRPSRRPSPQADPNESMGEAVAITYRLGGAGPATPVHQQAGRLLASGSSFEPDDAAGTLSFAPAFRPYAPELLDAQRRQAADTRLRWQPAEFGSVQARSLVPTGASRAPVLLWDGLNALPPGRSSRGVPTVHGLGGSLGLVQEGGWLTVLDAQQHSRVAEWRQPQAVLGAAWLPASRTLLLHTGPDPGGDNPPKLRSVRILAD